jgi:hypothetical protein
MARILNEISSGPLVTGHVLQTGRTHFVDLYNPRSAYRIATAVRPEGLGAAMYRARLPGSGAKAWPPFFGLHPFSTISASVDDCPPRRNTVDPDAFHVVFPAVRHPSGQRKDQRRLSPFMPTAKHAVNGCGLTLDRENRHAMNSCNGWVASHPCADIDAEEMSVEQVDASVWG